jgi:hypothetical protein
MPGLRKFLTGRFRSRPAQIVGELRSARLACSLEGSRMNNAGTASRRSPSPALRAGFLFSLAAALALGAPPGRVKAQAAPPERETATASWAVLDAVTTIGLDASTLSGLGLELTVLGPGIARHAPHPLSVAPREAPSFGAQGPIGLRATIAAEGFQGFAAGSLRHGGGFRLRGAAHTFDFSRLELRPGKKASSLELLDASGVALLATADAQWELDAGRGLLRYMNADLRILPAFARRLGDARYAGVTLGVLALDATLRVGPVPPRPQVAAGAAAPPPCGDWSGVVDVALVDMSSISPGSTGVVNGRPIVVVLPSAELENVGTANVPWYSKFTNLGQPPYDDQHPFLVWQMVRASAGVLEPIGRSDLKHAFQSGNTGCDPGACTDPHILGLGCADFYGTSTNNSIAFLAPRAEVTASTGIWAHCGGIPTHFDTNGDCIQDYFGSGENSFTHGMKVAETDLAVSGAAYFVEAFYIVRDDSNIFNSMGYRQVAPVKPSLWTFSNAGPYTQGPAINAWVNPAAPGANADNRVLDTGEGRVQLAVRVTDVLGSPGRRRFAYALQNHDFDRRIRSFHVPFNTSAGVIENVIYSDGDGFAANDWTWTVDATGITWTMPDTAVAPPTPPAALDYASLVSFRFDSDQNAAPAEARLDVFEAGPPGSPRELRLQTLAPATGGIPPADFHTLAPCRLLDTRNQPGGPAPIASGAVRELNVFAVGACGVPANAIAVAVNVTIPGGIQGGELAVYSAAPPATAGTVSFNPGVTRANNAIVLLSRDGKLKIRPSLGAAGSTHVVVDVAGYFTPGSP